jgi:hypothetical protein
LAGVVLFLAGPLRASVKVGAELDRNEIALGEQAVLTITVEGEAQDVQPPAIPDTDGLEVYGGGQSQRFSFVNGRVSATHSFTYYLRPTRKGQFQISPITVKVDGRDTPVGKVSLNVRAGGAPAPRPQQPQAVPDVDSGDRDVFITLDVDQDSVVVGQQVILTFGYYRSTRSPAFDTPQYTPPTTQGFWREDLPPERESTRVIRSRRYRVQEARYVLYPTHAGELEIGPAELHLSEDLFSIFRRSQRNRGPRVLHTKSLTVHVDPLPPHSGDFTGAVGHDFDLTASVDRRELAVGEALTLEVRLEGDGHLASARDPEIEAGDAFRVHEAGGGVDSRPSPAGLHGIRVVQKLLVPTKAGPQVIPSIEYEVFDTDQMKYRTLRTQPIDVQVTPGEGDASPTIVASGRSSEIELLARDIMHIRPIDPDLQPTGEPFVRRRVFWASLALPLLVWLGSGQLARRRRALLSDPRRLRDRRAFEKAKACLGDAQRSVDQRVDAAIRGYLADRAGLAAAGLRRDDLRRILSDLGGDAEQEVELLALLDQCDAVRFAPGSGDASALESRAQGFLSGLEARRAR